LTLPPPWRLIVDDDVDNGTDIICQVFRNQDHMLIYKTSPPSPPSSIVVKYEDGIYNFSIIISWESRGR
ncbi:hypothetical protein GBAR_LOCUS24353, partial [Geodia barretti]